MATTATSAAPLSDRQALGLALGFVGVVIFGGTLPATRVALSAFDPWFVTFGRAVVASILATAMLVLAGRKLPRDCVARLFAAGILLVFGFPVFSSLAMQTVPAAHGGVVLAVLPLLTAIFATALGGERPSALFWLCGAAGTLVVFLFTLREGGMALSPGDLYLFAAALSASLGYVISAKIARTMAGWEVICWALFLTAPLSLAGAIWSFRPEFAAASTPALVAFSYLGLGSMFLGFFFWNMGLAIGGIARVGQVQLLQSFVTLAISSWLLRETISGETMLFAFAVVCLVAIGQRARVRRSG